VPLFFCIGGLNVDHFQGVTAKERYDNELLSEIKRTNELLSQLIGHNGQMSDSQKNNTGRRKVVG
jgi:hypothetical protein